MIEPTNTGPRPAPLPIIPRPRPPESLAAYLRRLAKANHIRPSLLRSYLVEPPHNFGSVRASRLAAVTGRSAQALLRAFPDLQSAPRPRSLSSRRRQHNADRQELFEAIRREARTNFDIRSLTAKFGVHSRTIVQALVGVEIPAYVPPKNNPILEPFREYIDALLAAQPNISILAVWEHLVDHHACDVSYGTIRDYIGRQRR